jgi:hypothetical protein
LTPMLPFLTSITLHPGKFDFASSFESFILLSIL